MSFNVRNVDSKAFHRTEDFSSLNSIFFESTCLKSLSHFIMYEKERKTIQFIIYVRIHKAFIA